MSHTALLPELPRTPCLLLDERRMDANIAAMAQRMERLGARLRPHVKTHKSPEVMARQLAAGAAGITVATTREAEVMADAGADDILLAYPPVGAFRLKEIGELARRARLTVACSEPDHVRSLSRLGAEVDFYWEIEVGTGRLGTPPGEPTAEILDGLGEEAGARLTGILSFPGHAYAAYSGEERRRIAAAEKDALEATAEALRARGIDPGTLSAGATPLTAAAPAWPAEYRFGNYVFNDATQVGLESATLDECAVTVAATVVGRPAADRVILDAGSKALAAERMSAVTETFGIVRDHPELAVRRLYEEHAICEVAGATDLRLGDRVEVVPNHACTCVNLHEEYTVIGRDEGFGAWPVAARGWS